MQLSGFPGCCGVDVMHSLHGLSVEDIAMAVRDTANGIMLMASTSVENGRKTPQLLQKSGFKVIKRFKNSNSSNIVTVWGAMSGDLRKKLKKVISELDSTDRVARYNEYDDY